MDRLFAQVHPALGAPAQILLNLDHEPTTSYQIRWALPLDRKDVDVICEFVRERDDIEVVEQDMKDAHSVIVHCTHTDADGVTLRWLQKWFLPRRKYVAAVQVFTRVNPMVARLAVIGMQPIDYEPLLAEFREYPAFTAAQYDIATNTIVIIFAQAPTTETAADAIQLLGLHRAFSMTVMVDDATTPVIALETDQTE